MKVLWGASGDAGVPVKKPTRKELTELYGGVELRVRFFLAVSKRTVSGDTPEVVAGRRSRGGLAARTRRLKD